MKINSFYLFNLFNAATAIRLQSDVDIAFGNANPNHTFVLKSEYSEGDAFCEYDSCHLVLPPVSGTEDDINQYVVPFNGSETLTYDVCDTAGQSAVIYGHPPYQCADYSGAKINVTSTLNEVTASIINNSVQSVQVVGSSSPYKIVVTLFPESKNNVSMLLPSEPTHPRSQDSSERQMLTGIILFASMLGALGAGFIMLCLRYGCNKDKTIDVISSACKTLRNSGFGVFRNSSEERMLKNPLAMEEGFSYKK